MISLHDLRYVRLGNRRSRRRVHYAVNILGLELVRRDASGAYLRADDRDHTLVQRRETPRRRSSASNCARRASSSSPRPELDNGGYRVRAGTRSECEQRRVDAFIATHDPSGNAIELLVRPAHSGRRFFPSRDAGITGFSHIGLHSISPRSDEVFWTQACNARVSDWIGEAPLLRIDPVHHRIALFPSKRHGVQHINHQVESIDDIMRSYYLSA